jgi:hypothetical protein
MVSEKAPTKARNKRDDLTGEHAFGDAGQIILAYLFVGVWSADTFFPQYTTYLNGYVPLGVRIPFGGLLFIFSGYLARTGLAIVFGDRSEKPAVIRKDVFGVVRHPVYLSEILCSGSGMHRSRSMAMKGVI